jgi:hypothetical protein
MTAPKYLTVQRISYPGFTVSSGFAEADSLLEVRPERGYRRRVPSE